MSGGGERKAFPSSCKSLIVFIFPIPLGTHVSRLLASEQACVHVCMYVCM
jgi:hypothetical protein